MPPSSGLTARQAQILAHVQAQGFATIEAMSDVFNVSMQTIRRDLIELERQSFLIRFHGGAGLARDMVRVGYADKKVSGQAEKLRIARTISSMLPDGVTVYLDVGSTVESVARELLSRQGLHVVTPSAAVAMIFAAARDIDVLVTGGSLRGANGALVGEYAKAMLRDMRFDYVVTSFGGFDPQGEPMDFDPEKIALRQIVLANGRCRIGAVDSTKFTRQALMRTLGASAYTDLVTDKAPPDHISRALARSGTRLVVAPPLEEIELLMQRKFAG